MKKKMLSSKIIIEVRTKWHGDADVKDQYKLANEIRECIIKLAKTDEIPDFYYIENNDIYVDSEYGCEFCEDATDWHGEEPQCCDEAIDEFNKLKEVNNGSKL